MRKKVLALLCVMMMGTLCACGAEKTSAGEESKEVASNSETQVAKSEAPASEEPSAEIPVTESSIVVDGIELSFPITRTELNKLFADKGIVVFDESRYQIMCSVTNESGHYLYARFLSGDPEVCTSIRLENCEVTYPNLFASTVDIGSISDKVSAESSVFNVIDKGTENFDYTDFKPGYEDHNYIAFSSKDTGIVYEIDSYNAEYYSFSVYADENSYAVDGKVCYSINDKPGDYLSSTALKGLYRISPLAGPARHPMYYEFGGTQYEFTNAQITDWVSGGDFAPNGQYHWTYYDKFNVGTDDNGSIVEVFDKTAQSEFVSLDEKSTSSLAPVDLTNAPVGTSTHATSDENTVEIGVSTADSQESEQSDKESIDVSHLVETYGFYEYIGCTVSSQGTDLIVYDKTGKAVAVYHDDYEWNIKDIPIFYGGDPDSFPPHASEGDGLDFSCGYDENGNVLFFY